jgi:octaprenyl-diphosphate synthase
MFASNTAAKTEWQKSLPIENELKLVESTLRDVLDSSVQTIADVATHLLAAGGKRLRPALVILSAYAAGTLTDSDAMVKAAAGVELIHMATLVHDDVIDNAEFRRGKPTANSLWGNHISVLAGDYMLAKSFSLLAYQGNIRVMEAIARATIAMAEGEVHQIESSGRFDAEVAQYLLTIRNKTAEFISACCRIGAILANASKETEIALADYGLNLGIAFQIIDDILDLAGDPAKTGKSIGGDVREGKLTLPIILALRLAKPVDKKALENILQTHDLQPQDIDFVRKLLLQTGAIDEAKATASEYVEKATSCLQQLPASNARDSLEQLAYYILERDY